MRYYINVFGGSATVLAGTAGAAMNKAISENLHELRIHSGFDYVGFNIHGTSVAQRVEDTLEDIIDRASSRDERITTDNVRVVISESPVNAVAGVFGGPLLVNVLAGAGRGWEGAPPIQGQVTYDVRNIHQRDEAIMDVFQDIMIANSPLVQRVLQSFKSEGGTLQDFFDRKAAFAESYARKVDHSYATFQPDRYMSFSSLARQNSSKILSAMEIQTLTELWSAFLLDEMEAHLLTQGDAVEFAIQAMHHDTRNFEAKRHGFLSWDDVSEAVADGRLVTQTGAYVLCILTKSPKKNYGDLQAVFGERSRGRLNRVRLCSDRDYRDLRPLVRAGFVTPIRLLIKV